jgi:predicted Zn-dependent protease
VTRALHRTPRRQTGLPTPYLDEPVGLQLGVTDVDLYVPDLNFVFGEADAKRGVAVFSIARLYATDRDGMMTP